MKKIAFVLVMLVCCLPVFSQATYWSVSDSTLQIFDSPNANANVIFVGDKIQVFDVYEINNGWAKIKFRDSVAYIREDCIGEYEEHQKIQISKYHKTVEESSWYVNLIGMSALILLVCFIVWLFSSKLPEFLFFIKWGTFVFLSIFWVVYFSLYHVGLVNFTNFLFEEYPLYLIISLVLAPLIQIVSFFNLNEDIQYKCKSEYGLMLGLCSMVVGAVLCFILSYCDVDGKWIMLAFAVTELCQLVQSWIIFKSIKSKKGVLYSSLVVLTYLIGVHSAALAAAIILLLALLVFMFYYGTKIAIKLSLSLLDARPTHPNNSHYYY